MAGIYIHIPFCASRCIYCGFYSSTLSRYKQAYINAVCKEMTLRRNESPYWQSDIHTIYLGGGTPSQLSFEQLELLFTSLKGTYNIDSNAEITIECNPDDVTPTFVNQLRQLPVNRISMGAQSFNDHLLKFIHRRHNGEQIMRAVDLLKQGGYQNISIDLMFGFPGETIQQWVYDVQQAIALQIHHISAYSLMYEEGTPLYNMLQQQKIKPISDDLSLEMFKYLVSELTQHGFVHYEISNFAKPGFQSKHNSSYWNGTPYLGLGAAAHSYSIEQRQWNVNDIKQYIDSIENNRVPCTVEPLDLNTRYDDLITTALRTREGINLKQMREAFGTELYNYLINQSKKYIGSGLLQIANGCLSLTETGVYISDGIMSDLMHV